jgi:hypothetical protein
MTLLRGGAPAAGALADNTVSWGNGFMVSPFADGFAAYETRFQRFHLFVAPPEPRALPWAGMSDTFGVTP